MSPSRFDITDTGVDIDIAFTDKQGRLVSISFRENCPDLHPVPFLAPDGHRVYFSRYASELVIGEINTNGTKPIVMEQVVHGLNRSGNKRELAL